MTKFQSNKEPIASSHINITSIALSPMSMSICKQNQS